jgi:hypothetical protein
MQWILKNVGSKFGFDVLVFINHGQVANNGIATFVIELSCILITNPHVDTSSSGENIENMFEAEVFSKGLIQ